MDRLTSRLPRELPRRREGLSLCSPASASSVLAGGCCEALPCALERELEREPGRGRAPLSSLFASGVPLELEFELDGE